MITRYRVRLGNSQLDQQHKDIAIQNIEYSVPEKNVSQQSVANLDGFDIVNEKVVRQTVTVTFEIHTYNTATRNQICQAVNKWASAGGDLYTSDRANQLLRVKCEQYAAINARDWTAPLTLVFTSVGIPYWVSATQVTKTVSGKNVTSKLALDGNVGSARVSASVTSTKGKVKSIKLIAGDSSIELTGLNVAKNEQVVIDYVSYRYIRIRHLNSSGKAPKGYGSILTKLSPASSDNLSIPCGASSDVGVTADNNVKAVFTSRGWWL